MESIIEVNNETLEEINHLGLSYELRGLEVELTSLEHTAIHTPSPKEFDELMQICELGGWKWRGGELPTSKNYWGEYEKRTCVEAKRRMTRTQKYLFDSEGWKVILPQKFYDIEEVTQEDRDKVNEYFERVKPDRKSKG